MAEAQTRNGGLRILETVRGKDDRPFFFCGGNLFRRFRRRLRPAHCRLCFKSPSRKRDSLSSGEMSRSPSAPPPRQPLRDPLHLRK